MTTGETVTDEGDVEESGPGLAVAGVIELTAASKKAAIRLSGVSAEDRQWVLDRLPPEHSARVRRAYQQLQTLRGDRPLDFGEFFELGDSRARESHRDSDELELNRIAYDSVCDVLDGLSPVYVAAFLRTGLWQDHHDYLRDCAAARRARIEAARPGAITPRVAKALADSVARLVSQIEGV